MKIPNKRHRFAATIKISEKTSKKNLRTPTGMRLVDIDIFGQAICKLRCSYCNDHLALLEDQGPHGWQTQFYIKCVRCHSFSAQFPSSRPLDVPENTDFLSFHPERAMNEVTLRSTLVVHSSGCSWRDLHKFATIFDIPPPLAHMPQRYLQRLKSTVTKAVNISMEGAARDLHAKVDAVPSTETNCINIPVSFDASW